MIDAGPDIPANSNHEPLSFLRRRSLWLDQVHADPELSYFTFALAYVLARFFNERRGYFRALGLAYGDKNMALDLIAYTIRCILRSRVFPPSISEFVTEYEAVRNSTECVAERVRKAIKLRNQAMEAIRAACSKTEQPEANFTSKEAFSPGFSLHCKMKGD